MKSNDAILIALLTVLVIIVAWQGAGWSTRRGCGGCDGFHSGPAGGARPEPGTGYDTTNRLIDIRRGVRNDGYNQPAPLTTLGQIDRYVRYGANMTPLDLQKAEEAAWVTSGDILDSPPFDAERAYDAAAAVGEYHGTEGFGGRGLDYDAYITDLVVDPRTRENHERWVDEMKPWSGVSQKVDTLDEAMEATLSFQGLRRPQAVAQYNPLQLTEVDASILSPNKRFNFQG